MAATDRAQLIADAFAMGHQTWPDVSLPLTRFRGWVDQAEISAADLAARASDLYIVAACLTRQEAAIAVFDRAFIEPLGEKFGRATVTASDLDEIKQRLRIRLLTGDPPRVHLFRGQGSLAAFVRVTAARIAHEVGAAARPQQATAEAERQKNLWALLEADGDAELSAARREHRDLFLAALEEGFAALGQRERTILRMHFLDRASIDEIGLIYTVHRATAARWVVAARLRVLEHVRAKLELTLGGSSSEVRSLVVLLREDIDVSVRRLLGAAGG
jgi:RNA polymerase sigma-70 factor, ECF subfamily